MTHDEFCLDLEFYVSGTSRRWRVTDVGGRTIVAIRVDEASLSGFDAATQRLKTTTYPSLDAEALNLFDGPPYGCCEVVLDEEDLQTCIHVYEYMFGERP